MKIFQVGIAHDLMDHIRGMIKYFNYSKRAIEKPANQLNSKDFLLKILTDAYQKELLSRILALKTYLKLIKLYKKLMELYRTY